MAVSLSLKDKLYSFVYFPGETAGNDNVDSILQKLHIIDDDQHEIQQISPN